MLDLSCERYGKGADAQENHTYKNQWKNQIGKKSSRCLDEVNDLQ